MRFFKVFAAASLYFFVSQTYAATLQEMGSRLLSMNCYTDSCTYELVQPNMNDPLRFGIRLFSEAAPEDSLTEADYLIEWKILDSNINSVGFSAYFAGDYFRLRDRTLKEYHTCADITPFVSNSSGVQRQTQFYELLPQSIGKRLLEISSDSAYWFSVNEGVRNGKAVVRISGRENRNGYEACNFIYELEKTSLFPVYISLENNPGQIGENSVSVNYCTPKNFEGKIDMDFLTLRHGEELELYRTDGYTLENLPGRPAPRLTARTLQGDRFFYERGQTLDAPTIFAIVDSNVGVTPATVQAVVGALSTLPFRVDVVWAFIDKRPDDVTAVMEELPHQGKVLINAGSFARDTGAGHVTPVLIFVNRNGTVKDYIRGYNQDLVSLVIEKSTLCAGAE